MGHVKPTWEPFRLDALEMPGQQTWCRFSGNASCVKDWTRSPLQLPQVLAALRYGRDH